MLYTSKDMSKRMCFKRSSSKVEEKEKNRYLKQSVTDLIYPKSGLIKS